MNAYTRYLSTLARPFPAPVLAVVSKPDNTLAKDTKVHLWHDYPNGTRKPSMGKWKVVSHTIRKRPFFGHTWDDGLLVEQELVTVEYEPTQQTITRLRSTVCTATEYAAYLQALETGVQIAEAA